MGFLLKYLLLDLNFLLSLIVLKLNPKTPERVIAIEIIIIISLENDTNYSITRIKTKFYNLFMFLCCHESDYSYIFLQMREDVIL